MGRFAGGSAGASALASRHADDLGGASAETVPTSGTSWVESGVVQRKNGDFDDRTLRQKRGRCGRMTSGGGSASGSGCTVGEAMSDARKPANSRPNLPVGSRTSPPTAAGHGDGLPLAGGDAAAVGVEGDVSKDDSQLDLLNPIRSVDGQGRSTPPKRRLHAVPPVADPVPPSMSPSRAAGEALWKLAELKRALVMDDSLPAEFRHHLGLSAQASVMRAQLLSPRRPRAVAEPGQSA